MTENEMAWLAIVFAFVCGVDWLMLSVFYLAGLYVAGRGLRYSWSKIHLPGTEPP